MSKTSTAILFLILVGALDILLDFVTRTDFTVEGVFFTFGLLWVQKESKKRILLIYCTSLILIVADFFVVFSRSNVVGSSELNSVISIISISLSTYIILRRKQTEEKAKVQQEKYIASMEEILFMTSHELRNPICSLQGLIDVTTTHEEHTLDEFHSEIATCVGKLDEYSRDLTKFVDKNIKTN